MNRLPAVLAGMLLAVTAFDLILWRAAGQAREHNQQLLARVAAIEAAGVAPGTNPHDPTFRRVTEPV